MEDFLRSIYQERASHQGTLGIIKIEKRRPADPLTDKFDIVLLVIVNHAEHPLFIKHYHFQDQKAALYVVVESKLKEWLLMGTNRRAIDWILNGKIIFDRNEYILHLKDRLHDFPEEERKLKIGIEFAKLIRRYLDGKAFFESQEFIDSYNHIVHALHHLARLEVIHHGFHPEVLVWNQVKQIEPQIYKLYVELLESDEPLDKRLELLFLASEFLINSRAEIGAQHLLEILMERNMWSFAEIMNHPQLEMYTIDLGVLLEYLVGRRLVQVKNIETKRPDIYHRYYTVHE
jgi:hypothetical protein